MSYVGIDVSANTDFGSDENMTLAGASFGNVTMPQLPPYPFIASSMPYGSDTMVQQISNNAPLIALGIVGLIAVYFYAKS